MDRWTFPENSGGLGKEAARGRGEGGSVWGAIHQRAVASYIHQAGGVGAGGVGENHGCGA